jgi:peptide/nickel transport system ATP-binding protein
MDNILSVRGLKVDIPLAGGVLHAVRGIDFDLNRGETLCIVGESGSGKSLTSLAIMGLLPKMAERSSDKLEFSGIDLATAKKRQMRDLRGNRISMIFQEPMTSLNPAYTIGDQLTEALLLHRKVDRKAAEARAIELLEKVGITAAASRLGQYPHQLSGGLRQRVMIAMALMGEPDLIIADEPTTALDVTIQAQILRLLVDLQREMNMAMILITHDLGVVARVADKVAIMYAGEVVEAGTSQDVFNAPRHPYTRGLLRCIPVPGKTRPGEHLGSIPGIVPSLIGETRGCAFRGRCDVAVGACEQAIPERTTETGHLYRCVHSGGYPPDPDASEISSSMVEPDKSSPSQREDRP